MLIIPNSFFSSLTGPENIYLNPWSLATLLLGADNVPATKANNSCLALGYASSQHVISVVLDGLSNVDCYMNVMVYEVRAPWLQ